jgi:ABC-type oligopeptide transport system ATPase subunit
VSEPLLSVRGLKKHFSLRRSGLFGKAIDIVTAVDGIDFDLEQGQTLGLVGESGSGKSTTGYCVLQLLRPTAGEVLFRGEDLTKLRGRALRSARREMQVVFQDPYSALDPRMSIGRIVAEPLDAHGVGSRRSRRSEVRRLLDLVGLGSESADRYPHEFSGGQRQRVGIARAVALNPKLIVCDEPVSALDVSIQAQILNLLKDLQERLGLAYLFISHDLGVVRSMSDEIAVMNHGRIVESGSAEAVFSAPTAEYTRSLLESVPVPDPRRMRARAAAAQRMFSETGPT